MNSNVQNRHPHRAAASLLGAALCTLVGSSGNAAPAAPAIEYSGCAVVLAGPRCVLRSNRELRLWIDRSAAEPLRMQAGNAPLVPAASRQVGGGVLHDLTVPDGAEQLTVLAGSARWQLALEEEVQPAVFSEALALFREGKPARGRELLESQLPQLPAKWHGKALNYVGQFYRREGNDEAAQRNLQASVAASAGAGRHSEAIKTATVLAFMLVTDARDMARARNLLHELMPVAPGDADSRYDMSYHLGLVAFNAGNARVALRELEQASAQAARMGNALRKSYADFLLAVQLQQIGRRQLASELLAEWVGAFPDDISACNRALHLTNLGWSRLLILEAGESAPDPIPALTEALSIVDTQCSANDRMNVLTNLALAHLHAGDAASAAEHVARARQQTDAPRLRNVLWLLDIEARTALALDDTSQALALYSQLQALADATLSTEASWRAAVGKAMVQRAMGDTDGSLRSFERADSFLTQAIFSVPLNAGRETLASARAWATRQHLELLLDAGANERAFAVARAARSRVLASLSVADRIAMLQPAARARWEQALAQYRSIREALDASIGSAWMLPADALERLKRNNQQQQQQLRRIIDDAVASLNVNDQAQQRAPQSGELLMAFHPLPAGWAVFAHDGAALEVSRSNCSSSDDAALAACLMRPFARQIRQASVVRLLPVGRLRAVDFHAVGIDSGTAPGKSAMIDSAAVVYAADFDSAPRSLPRSGNALLVADGLGDLAAAREELELVNRILLSSNGWRSNMLSGDQARPAAVLREIAGAGLFHFAGHARFQGALGWDSALKLADGTALDVTDILTLDSAPALVVLSGCETGRTVTTVQPESMGLANAFLVAGSAGVIATTRPVRDDTARSVVASFYEAWIGGEPAHQALRVAQLQLRDQQQQSDWSAFRLIER